MEKKNKKTTGKYPYNLPRKMYWPDMVFGPVNLWSLPPALFFIVIYPSIKISTNRIDKNGIQ